MGMQFETVNIHKRPLKQKPTGWSLVLRLTPHVSACARPVQGHGHEGQWWASVNLHISHGALGARRGLTASICMRHACV